MTFDGAAVAIAVLVGLYFIAQAYRNYTKL